MTIFPVNSLKDFGIVLSERTFALGGSETQRLELVGDEWEGRNGGRCEGENLDRSDSLAGLCFDVQLAEYSILSSIRMRDGEACSTGNPPAEGFQDFEGIRHMDSMEMGEIRGVCRGGGESGAGYSMMGTHTHTHTNTRVHSSTAQRGEMAT